MQKKIALIWPNHHRKSTNPLTPLWALSLGTYLKEKIPDIKIRILDGQIISSGVILKKISQFKPDIVGISLSYCYYKKALMFAKKAKSLGAKVVFGGNYAAATKKEILQNRGPYSNDYCVDAVIQRDGEKSFYEYVVGKQSNRINNLVYQTKRGIKENPIELLDLDSLPILDRNLLNLEYYLEGQRRFRKGVLGERKIRRLNFYFEKGCWWREKTGGCIFCSSIETPLRLRNPKIFAKEINDLVFKYNIDHIKIDGEDFLADEQWFKNFVKFYQPYLIKYNSAKFMPFLSFSTRADRITDDNIKMFKKINVRSIFIGFESGDQECLVAIKKGISLATIKKTISLLNKYQIWLTGSFIFGLPGETSKAIQRTLSLIKKISLLDCTLRISFQMFTPLPGSLSWQMFIKKTGSKYVGKDLIDWNEARKDWLRYFCHLDYQDIIKAEGEFKQLARQQDKIRFFLIDEIKF